MQIQYAVDKNRTHTVRCRYKHISETVRYHGQKYAVDKNRPQTVRCRYRHISKTVRYHGKKYAKDNNSPHTVRCRYRHISDTMDRSMQKTETAHIQSDADTNTYQRQ